MTRDEFEKYIHENKLESLFTRDRDMGGEFTLQYTKSDEAVKMYEYGCLHDEKGYYLASCTDGERGNEIGGVYSDHYETEEEALDELKRIVDCYKGYTIVHSYKDSVNKFLKVIAGKTIEPPFRSKWDDDKYDISFSELDSLINQFFPGCPYVYDLYFDDKINIIAPEHVRILSVKAVFQKAVYWEFEDKRYIMFNELGGTYCDYDSDETGIYSLYYNSLYIMIKYGYDGSILYKLERGDFSCFDAIFSPKFFSTYSDFKDEFPYEKYLGITNGTVSIIIERKTCKIVHSEKNNWQTKNHEENKI